MVPVPMNDDGPDADAVAALAADDPSFKGMWLVPTHANPTGQIASQEVAERLASMPTAAPDFKIFWDNAYALHHLTAEETKTADILSLAAVVRPPAPADHVRVDLQDHLRRRRRRVPGGSAETVAWYHGHLGHGSIGPDKVNQLRHVQFFGSPQGVRDHMDRHRELIAPKFARGRADPRASGSAGSASRPGPTPPGGYFVSLDVLPGTATRVIELAKAAGVALTPGRLGVPRTATTPTTPTSGSRPPSRPSTR